MKKMKDAFGHFFILDVSASMSTADMDNLQSNICFYQHIFYNDNLKQANSSLSCK